jgi:DNA helicase-2/ATP-dependent DNA helicase PcrA
MDKPTDSFPWLADLNPEQRQAVTHGHGHLLVVAGAGSGKTRTLAYRVAYLIATGADPSRILLLTFTRRASEEMLKRAAAVVELGARASGRVWGGTFHAIANRLLRTYAAAAGLNPDFTVMDQSDAEDLLNVIRHELDLHKKETRFPRKSTCLAIYSRCVNGTAGLADVLQRHFPWCEMWQAELKELFRRYVERKQQRNVMDYDDLLLYWAQLVADDGLAARIGGRFDHILVDEYQDTNCLQSDILRGMAKGGGSVMAVGDDAQSIYSFRAATVRNMLDFPKHFPDTTIVTLRQNYRSVMPILDVTNRVIAQARERYTKDLWSTRRAEQRPLLVTCKDEAEQDAYVIDRILEHREQGIVLRKQAVLFRAAHLSDSLEIELARRNIPYHKYGGLRFLEAAHVKDLIAFLRILENPRDEMAWFRVLQLFDGIGPSTAGNVVAHVARHNNNPCSIAEFRAPLAAQDDMAEFAKLLEQLAGTGKLNPAAQVDRIRRFYDPLLKKRYENPAVRARDLENLEQIASGYRSRSRFLTDLQLDPPNSTGDLAGPPVKDDDWLVLSTIHSAKGCEWDAVYLIHAADGCLPSDMATGSAEEIEEELRLAYVAMTRARDFLYVTWPIRYYHKWYKYTDRHSYAQLCRFLTEDVRAGMAAVRAAPEDEESAEEVIHERADIAGRIKAMWD